MSVTPSQVRITPAVPASRVDAFLLARFPLSRLVRWIAGIQASVRVKLLSAFLLIAVLIMVVLGTLGVLVMVG